MASTMPILMLFSSTQLPMVFTRPELIPEPLIRMGCFLGVLLLMGLWETIAPCRPRSIPRYQRWPGNLGLVVLNTLLLRSLLPMTAVHLATIATVQGWGVCHWLGLPQWLAVILSLVLLDLLIYGQHVLFHHWPPLWQLHQVHHADPELDVTTGLRFHPGEILLSMGIKFAAIVLLGPPVIAVLIFEVLLNATAMFNHSNVSLPRGCDRVLRWFVVTPDMHRIHHSVIPEETNSNFGFNLPWWDYYFGTYRDRPSLGDREMTIGLAQYQQDGRVTQLPWLLLLPWYLPSRTEPEEKKTIP